MRRNAEQPRRKAPEPPVGAPWVPPPWEPEDVGAIQALMRGEAEPHQQTRALKYIVETLSDYYGISYRPDGLGGQRDTDFAEGKRFVGQQIVKLTKINLSKLKRITDGGPSEQP
jgi:hypothetical protein